MQVLLLLLLLLLAISSTLVFCTTASGSECIHGEVGRVLNVSKTALDENHFTTIQAAINEVPSNDSRWTYVYVSPGIYREKLEIPKDKQCLVLQGESASNTIITYDAHGKTSDSPTLTTNAPNFKASRIGFVNSAGLDSGERAGQAVAIWIRGDKSAFYECRFVGYQDTVWDADGRHYFKSCDIQGAVDFIFGHGQSVYEDCKINVTGGGDITAQGRYSETDPSGFVFIGGSVSGNAKTYLGRAFGINSRVIYHGTYFSDIIQPLGWEPWRATGKENYTVYAEVDCKGPGANTADRVKWAKELTPSELSQYTVSAFIDQDGWIAKQP